MLAGFQESYLKNNSKIFEGSFNDFVVCNARLRIKL